MLTTMNKKKSENKILTKHGIQNYKSVVQLNIFIIENIIVSF